MIDDLVDKIVKLQNPTCVGLDTSLSYLPDDMREGADTFERAAERIAEFNLKIIDAVKGIVPAVKLQIAYYEMYGEEGLKVFRLTGDYARENGMYVIADCKRGDIGSTAECYAKAYLGETELEGDGEAAYFSDALTVNGYLGTDGVKPFAECARKNGKSIFVLVKTSNPSSGELQDLELCDGRKVYEAMGDIVAEWGKESVGRYGYSEVGAVVGATYPEEGASLRKRLPQTFFLIPGYGAQGASAKDIRGCFDDRGLGGVVNSSRGIICAYRDKRYAGLGFAEAARAAAEDMRDDLRRGIGKMG